MNRAWIAHHHSLCGIAHRIDDDQNSGVEIVVRRESLDVVRSTADLVKRVRWACAQRLKVSRARERQWQGKAREAAMRRTTASEAEIHRSALTETARIATALADERRELRRATETLIAEISQQAARRLLLAVPPDWAIQSSANLLLDDWRAMRGEGVARLRVHPDDLNALKEIAEASGWTLESDITLARGHCELTHAAGSLHATYGDNVCALIDALGSPSVAPIEAPSKPANLTAVEENLQ